MAGMQFEQTGVQRAHDPLAGLADTPDPDKAPVHPLDSDETLERWRKVKAWLADEKSQQSDARIQMAVDDDFYDHLQWKWEDIAVLNERRQSPLVFNRCSLAINWLYGTALRTKTDSYVHPRERDDEALAPIKTKLLKYVDDVNYASQCRLRALKDALKTGVGWIDHGLDTDPTAELLRVGYESWRNVWYDSRGRDPALKDWRYQFREKWLDDDVGVAMFPARAHLIAQSATGNEDMASEQNSWASYENELNTGLGGTSTEDSFGGNGRFGRFGIADALDGQGSARKRVRLTEAWYRVPVARQVMRGQVYNGQTFDPNDPKMQKAVREHVCSIVGNVSMRMHYMLWCDAGVLAAGESPFRHNRFPLVPIFCYRRAGDGTPYGVIRGMRDAQEDYNKRASKALHILSTRGVLFEEGAFEVDDIEEVRDEVARTDFMIGYKAGRKVEFIRDTQLSQGHLDLMDRDAMHMESSSGVTNELVAMQTQAVSGVAIERRQAQGQLTTSEPFENYRFACQLSGEIRLSMVEQFYSEPKSFRITGEQNKPEFVDINQPQFDEAANDWTWTNDITKRQADFVMSETDFRESVRQAQAEVTLEFLAKLPPEASMKFFDLAVELMDLPNKSEWLKRARDMAGVQDPDLAKTPEGQAELAKIAERNAFMEQAEQRQIMAQIDKLEADVKKVRAEGKKIDAAAIQLRMDAILKAMDAGTAAVTVPGVTPAADVLLDGAGFVEAINGTVPGAAPQITTPLPMAA